MGYYISGFTDEDFDVRESYRDIRLFFEDGKFTRATMPTGTKPYYKELKVVEVKVPHGRLIDAEHYKAAFLKEFLDEVPTAIDAEEE